MARIAVVRGGENINVTELGMFARLTGFGHHVELVCSSRTWVTESDAGMPERRLPPPPVSGRIAKTRSGGFLIGQVSPYRFLHQYLRGFHRAVRDYELLSPVDLGHPSSYQSILERKYGKRVLLYCAENIPFNWPHDRPLREHFERVLDESDHFLATTEGVRRALKAQGVGESRIHRLNVGIDVSFWRPAVSKAVASPGALRVLFVGRLHWQKGLQTVFEALEQCTSPVELTVIGRGPEEPRLRWLLDQRSRRGNPALRGRVRFVSHRVSQEELLRFRQSADVQLVPSIPTSQWREQMNFAMLEGLSCGVPAIATRTGGIPEAVADGIEGLLVSPDSPEELAVALDQMAGNPELRQRMRIAARHRIEREFNLETQARSLADLLRYKLALSDS